MYLKNNIAVFPAEYFVFFINYLYLITVECILFDCVLSRQKQWGLYYYKPFCIFFKCNIKCLTRF